MPYYESGGGTATSGTINGSLGFTIRWIKVGRVVSMYFDNDTTNIPTGGAHEIYTLPDELVPAVGQFSCANRYNQNKCSFSISTTNKKLQVYNDSSTAQYYIGGSMTYISKE